MNYFFANRYALGVIALFVFSFLLFSLFISAPADFPTGTIFQIEHGDSLRVVSLKLEEAHIIRSRLAFEVFVIIFGREKGIIETDYYFENKLSVYEVARRISKGEHHLASVVVTVPEGFNTMQIADVFDSKLVNFDKSKFLEKATELEGYLFPDTYFFQRTDTEENVIKSMNKNFEKKMLALKSEIALSLKSEREIIIVASIIEREAKEDVDRGFISGILWNRLKINMPLQVDVAPETYRKKGLPQGPISNPGLKSILAAIHPKMSPYLFFLYDKKDDIHYAKTFAEHRQNIVKYLK